MAEIRIDADKAERMIAQIIGDNGGLLPAKANTLAADIGFRQQYKWLRRCILSGSFRENHHMPAILLLQWQTRLQRRRVSLWFQKTFGGWSMIAVAISLYRCRENSADRNSDAAPRL